MIEIEGGEARFPGRQHFVLVKTRSPTLPLSLSFVAEGEKDVKTGYITFIFCPFGQRYASIS